MSNVYTLVGCLHTQCSSRITNFRLGDTLRQIDMDDSMDAEIEDSDSESDSEEAVEFVSFSDEDDDEDDNSSSDAQQESAESVPTNSVLWNYFKKIQNDVGQAYPRVYKSGTFWIEPPLPFFALQQKLDPAALYLPRVFLWLPHLLIEGDSIECPSCADGKLTVKQWNTNPHARRVIDLDG